MEPEPGALLYEVLQRAADLADTEKETVAFDFNGIEHDVSPWEGEPSWRARAAERCGHDILTREELAEKAKTAKTDLERREREEAAAIAVAGVPTEKELREADVPWPESEMALVDFIRTLVDRPHDYGTCVYAMSMAATATFQYVAKQLGVTGFQASCADMDILRRTRNLKHGFRIIDYGDILYPQHWDEERTPIFQAVLRDSETRERLAAEAEKNLVATEYAHPAVRAHWEVLVGRQRIEREAGAP
jgi:hypothetical protein